MAFLVLLLYNRLEEKCPIPSLDGMNVVEIGTEKMDTDLRNDLKSDLNILLTKFKLANAELSTDLFSELKGTIVKHKTSSSQLSRTFYQSYQAKRNSLCGMLKVMNNNTFEFDENKKKAEKLLIELFEELSEIDSYGDENEAGNISYSNDQIYYDKLEEAKNVLGEYQTNYSEKCKNKKTNRCKLLSISLNYFGMKINVLQNKPNQDSLEYLLIYGVNELKERYENI